MSGETKVLGSAAEGFREFVVRVLGCECPPEVLDDIRVRAEPREIAGLPLELRLNVGGRLLVFLASTDATARVVAALGAIVEAGRRTRDAEGFHRFRFVLATSNPADALASVSEAFAALPERDDRLHLHVVNAGELPKLLEKR